MKLHFTLNTKNKKMLLVITFVLFSNVLSFAQNPSDVTDPSDTNPLDTPAAPINDYILETIGTAFVYGYFVIKKTIKI